LLLVVMLIGILGALLSVFKEVLKSLGSLKGALISYASSSFDCFGHLSGFSELDSPFLDPYVVVDEWWAYYVVQYAGGESM
jgi:hypothetical protein